MATGRRAKRLVFGFVALVVAGGLAWWLRPSPPIVVTRLSSRVVPAPPAVETVDGAPLRLNGAGIRYALNWEVYVAALYVPGPVREAREVLDGSGNARIVLLLRHEVTKAMIDRAFRGGVERAAGDDAEGVVARLGPFFELVRDVKAGERVVLTWRRGRGLEAEFGADRAVVDGDEAARAVFGIWLGERPVDPILRAELLEGAP